MSLCSAKVAPLPENDFRVMPSRTGSHGMFSQSILCRSITPSLFGFAEDASRSDKKKDQQNRQSGDVLQARAECDDSDRLRQPQHDAAHEGTERIAEAADDGGDKSGDRKRHADIERSVLRW